MAKSDSVRLKHMLEAAQTCLEFADNKTREDFEKDKILVFAVIRALEIFGEAAANISKQFQLMHSIIPWRAIIGMRNRLIHVYFDIDYDIVWEAINSEIPKIIPQIKKLIAEIDSESK